MDGRRERRRDGGSDGLVAWWMSMMDVEGDGVDADVDVDVDVDVDIVHVGFVDIYKGGERGMMTCHCRESRCRHRQHGRRE